MTDVGEKKNSKLWGLWVVIEDYDSATKAARNASIAAFYLAFSYVIIFDVTYYTGNGLYGEEYVDEIEVYFANGFNAFGIILFLWLGFRIRKGKFGSVPFVALWMLIEIGYKFMLAPGKGIFLSIIFTVVAINALLGWYKRKEFLKAQAEI